MRKKIRICLSVFLLMSAAASGQRPSTAPGEKLTFGAYYNWHFVWLRCGEANLFYDTLATTAGKRLKMYAEARTFKFYDKLYRVRDTIESVAIPGTFAPEFYEQSFSHAGEQSYYQYRVPPPRDKIYSAVQRFDKKPFNDTLKMAAGLTDMLATVYDIRTQDFDKLNTGDTVSFKMLVDNEIHNIFYRYLGKETIKNRNKISFSCYKLSILLLEGDFFPGGEDMKVWIEDSPNRIPVMAEAKILVGSVKGIIESAEINGEKINFELLNP